jgi:FkbM family methyltransferase
MREAASVRGASSRYREAGWLERVGGLVPDGSRFSSLRAAGRPILERLMRWRTRGGLRSVFPGGESVLVDPAFRHLAWNPSEYAAFRRATRTGSVVLDIGANVGGYSVLFAQWTGKNGQVFAFEPAPASFAGLKRHIDLNGAAAIVVPVQAAILDGTAASVPFEARGTSGDNRVVVPSAVPGPSIVVRATSIDEFCSERSIAPDVIKIDVEGAELSVLRGARRTIRARGAALELFVEMHPAAWPSFGTSAVDLLDECASLGLTPVALDTPRPIDAVEGVCFHLVRTGS